MSTEVRSPFDRPLSELRQIYLEARLKSRTSINDTWLENMRLSPNPPDEQHSLRLNWAEVAEHLPSDIAATLWDKADPIDKTDPAALGVLLPEVPRPLMPYLVDDRFRFYLHHHPAARVVEDTTVVVCGGPDLTHLLMTVDLDDNSHLFNETTGMDLLAILFATWRNHGPRWEQARQLVCDAIQVVLEEIEQEAGEQFNSAVAVREDGSDPLHASWVVVFDDNGRELTIYSAAEFLNHKILRAPDTKTLRPKMSYSTRPHEVLLMAVGQHLSRGGIWAETIQGYIRGHEAHEGGATMRIFITHKRHCPKPLPDYGNRYVLYLASGS